MARSVEKKLFKMRTQWQSTEVLGTQIDVVLIGFEAEVNHLNLLQPKYRYFT